MKIWRMMSRKELNAVLDGKTVENKTNWKKEAYSKAKGFCFVKDEMTPGAVNALRNSMFGKADDEHDFAVEFEVVREDALDKSEYEIRGWMNSKRGEEWSTTTYSTKTMYPTKVYSLAKLEKLVTSELCSYRQTFFHRWTLDETEIYTWDETIEKWLMMPFSFRVVK